MQENDINNVYRAIKENNVSNYIILKKGLFKDIIPKLHKDSKFCFAYVDCDLYQGTKEALEYLLPRINKGGIIFIDDYTSSNWVGVKKAVLELLPKNEIKEFNGQAYWIKI